MTRRENRIPQKEDVRMEGWRRSRSSSGFYLLRADVICRSHGASCRKRRFRWPRLLPATLRRTRATLWAESGRFTPMPKSYSDLTERDSVLGHGTSGLLECRHSFVSALGLWRGASVTRGGSCFVERAPIRWTWPGALHRVAERGRPRSGRAARRLRNPPRHRNNFPTTSREGPTPPKVGRAMVQRALCRTCRIYWEIFKQYACNASKTLVC